MLKIGAVLVAAQAVLWAGVPGALADDVNAGSSAQPSVAGSGVVVVGAFAPGMVQRPAGAAHWTLREQAAIARAAEASDQAARRTRRARADVSMFPWREILFYAMGVVIVIGALLVFTGSHGRQSRHN